MFDKVKNYLFEDIYKVNEDRSQISAINFKGESYSFKDIEKSVDFYANFLKENGVKKGDHVALLSMNSFNWLVSFFAIIKVGGVAVLINYMARHQTLVELINFTDCKFICYGKYKVLLNRNSWEKCIFYTR